MSQQSTIDMQVIQNLLDLGGIDLLTELKSVFISSSQTLIQDMQSALIQNDYKALKNQAHSLKSSSANIGALKLSLVCLKIENAALEKNLVLSKELSMQLIQEFNHVCEDLSAVIQSKS